MNNMKWLKINKDNLPEGQVLGGNFKAGTFGYKEKLLGNIYISAFGTIHCESESEYLDNCSHYIDINKYDLNE